MNAIALPGLAEPVAALSHLFAAALALAAAARLLRQVWGTGGGRVLAYGIFAGSAVALLGISGLYHALPLGSAARAFMQRMDHAAIFLLIAGSFTPLLLDNFHGLERALLTIVVWVCALSGVALKVFFFHAIPQSAGLAMYLGLGWFGVVVGGLAARRFGIVQLLPLLYGGLLYTVGALSDFLKWPMLLSGVVRPHEVFHFFVVAALAVHWVWIAKRAQQRLVPRMSPVVIAPVTLMR